MLRSLYSAISGLKNHQIKMDVIGNNIANVNTAGFKRSRVTFSTMLSQTLQGASSPSDTQGGTNPAQIGLGSMLASIDQIMTPGSSQSTGKNTDAMIQGSGFFVLKNAGQTVYSRAGSFSQDTNGTLIDPATGAMVMGYMWGVDDTVPADFNNLANLKPLRFALGDALPQKTEIVLPAQPMDGTYPSNGWVSSTIYSDPSLVGVYIDDLPTALGVDPDEIEVVHDPTTGTITFKDKDTATGDTVQDAVAAAIAETSDPATPLRPVHQASISLLDYPDTPAPGDPGFPDATLFPVGGWENPTTYVNTAWKGASISNLALVFGENATFDSATGTLSFKTAADAYDSLANTDSTTGTPLAMSWAPPTLESFSIDQKGIITGVYSNGIASATHRIGQLAIAKFANDAGLTGLGGNFFAASNNSGEASIGAAGEEGRGTITPNTVEMSNVDLSQEFTDMIVTQRGFQANSRVITVSDSLLQELIDLKRG